MVERSTRPGPADPSPHDGLTPTLALRTREAAQALRISPRLLSTLVAEGRIPHVRVNSVLLFPVRELQDWLTAQSGTQVQP